PVVRLLLPARWLGGRRARLGTLVRAPAPPPTASVIRFCRLAFLPVGVLAVTGVYQSWRGLGSWDALTGTPYGKILTAKLVAVALLLAAAGLSRRWTGRLARAQAPAEEAVTVPERVPELVTA